MLTCAEGSTDELKVYIHTPAFARPQCQTSSPKPLDQPNPNFVWNLHGHGARGGVGGERMFAASRSHDRQGGRKAARPYMVKPFKIISGTSGPFSTEPMTQAYHCLFKLLPWVDLDLFYDKVKFCNLGFSIGKLFGAPCDRKKSLIFFLEKGHKRST